MTTPTPSNQPPRPDLSPFPGPLAERSVTMELERAKLDHQKEQAAIQVRLQQRQIWVSAIATAVPLLVAALTLAVGVYNQSRASRAQFQLKAAELIMAAEGPAAARDRVKAMQQLFGDQLSPAFGDSVWQTIGAPGRDRKMALLELLAAHPANRLDILRSADVLFPETDFIKALRALSTDSSKAGQRPQR